MAYSDDLNLMLTAHLLGRARMTWSIPKASLMGIETDFLAISRADSFDVVSVGLA